MPNKYEQLAKDAAQMTDDHFKNEFSGLTSLTDDDVAEIITQTGISKQDLAKVLQEVKNATDINETTAKNIGSITKGVSTLVAIAKKFL